MQVITMVTAVVWTTAGSGYQATKVTVCLSAAARQVGYVIHDHVTPHTCMKMTLKPPQVKVVGLEPVTLCASDVSV